MTRTRPALPFDAPHPRLLLLEQRAGLELGALLTAAPWLRVLGRGDQHPVLVLPGFSASDAATVALRWQLRTWGYWAHGWRLGANLGPTPAVMDSIVERLAALHRRHDRPVTLLGWSLGGVYARQIARDHPTWVRTVITLGSPFRMTLAATRADLPVPNLARNVDLDLLARLLGDGGSAPVPVPTTSIYSRTDGIVRWKYCLDEAPTDHTPRENIEVPGSHVGLVVNPLVLVALADRLRQTADDWRPFVPPTALRRWYPEPRYWAGPSRSDPPAASSPTFTESEVR